MTSSFFAFIHHVAAFALVAALAAEHMLFEPKPSLPVARRLMRLDMLYGISAAVLVGVGFLRAVYFEKGWAYYSASPYFLGKMALFAAIALLSVYPTIVFLSWRKDVKAGCAPQVSQERASAITILMRLQLVLVAGVLFAAAAMAKGG